VIASAADAWLGQLVPEAAGADFAPAAREGFRVRDFLAGGRTLTVIKGRDRVGALYGVYAYLEKVGVKFLGLGEKAR
jgi:alpha-glucuronidase